MKIWKHSQSLHTRSQSDGGTGLLTDNCHDHQKETRKFHGIWELQDEFDQNSDDLIKCKSLLEEHSVEKNVPVYDFNKSHTMLTRGFYQWWW